MATQITDRLDAAATVSGATTDLQAIEALSGTGILARTGTNAWSLRSLAAPSAGITVTFGDGASGNPTLVLANDLAAVEGLASTGIAVRTGTDAWAQRTITGTANVITVTNGSGAGGNPTLTIGSAVARLDTAGQAVTGGGIVTSNDLGTKSSGTLTLSMGDRPLQHYTNNGAHTLAPGTNAGSCYVDVTNGASAGAVTTSGWTKVSGAFDTTNAHKFRCSCSVGNNGSLLQIIALQ